MLMTSEIAKSITTFCMFFGGWLSSRTLVVVRRSMERDRHVIPPVRRPLRPSAGRLPVEERGQQSVKCQHSDILQPPSPGRRSLGLMAADRVSTGRDRTTNCMVDDSHCRLLGPARSGGLWDLHPSDSLQSSPYFIGGSRTWADAWSTPGSLDSPCHRRLTSATSPRISIHWQLDN